MRIGFVELIIVLIILMSGVAVIAGILLALTGRFRIGSFKTCPHCAERIQPAARICRYCQREVNVSDFENRPKGLFQ